PSPDGPVSEIVISQPTIYVAGSFTAVANQARCGLAAIDFDGAGQLLPWNPCPQGGTVRALVAAGDVNYAGGTFTNIGGASRNRLAALDADSGLATSWTTGTNSLISSIDALAIS